MCRERVKKGNKGKLLESMGKDNDILIFSLRGYIWNLVERILERIQKDVGTTYQILENHGANICPRKSKRDITSRENI